MCNLYSLHGISVDNHAIIITSLLQTDNGRMYSEELHDFILNPFKWTPERLYLMFDMTHNLKNVYKNWINKGSFTFPGTHSGDTDSVELDSNEIGPMMTASFNDVFIWCTTRKMTRIYM